MFVTLITVIQENLVMAQGNLPKSTFTQIDEKIDEYQAKQKAKKVKEDKKSGSTGLFGL